MEPSYFYCKAISGITFHIQKIIMFLYLIVSFEAYFYIKKELHIICFDS